MPRRRTLTEAQLETMLALPADEARKAVRVVAVHPIAQGLPVHARRPRRIRTLVAVQAGRVAAQYRRRMLRPRDRNRHVCPHHRAGKPNHSYQTPYPLTALAQVR